MGRKRKRTEHEGYVAWSDLELDAVLGDYTDMELRRGSSGSDSDVAVDSEPMPKKTRTSKPHKYLCPDCGSGLRTITGFRGHMRRKHNRTDVRATAHRKTSSRGHPFSSAAEFGEVYAKCATGALQSIVQDPRMNLEDSAHGADIIRAAKRALDKQDTFAFLLSHFEELFVTESSCISMSQFREQQRVQLHRLRTNAGVRDKFVSHVAVEHGASTRVGHMLFAMVLRHFTNSFLELQIDALANKENTTPGVQLDDEDRDVIAYICGYVIRRVLAKGSAYREGLASVLGSREPAVGVPSEWITSKDRGGLLYPSRDFYGFMEGCEQTLRGLTDLEHLSADSLLRDQLKEDLLENSSLQQRWDLIGGSADTLMREKVTDLFLTIRGHASARRVMRQYAKKQASNRTTKSLRKSLQSHFQDSA